MKEEALHRTVWRTRFWRDNEPLVRQTTWWWWWWWWWWSFYDTVSFFYYRTLVLSRKTSGMVFLKNLLQAGNVAFRNSVM